MGDGGKTLCPIQPRWWVFLATDFGWDLPGAKAPWRPRRAGVSTTMRPGIAFSPPQPGSQEGPGDAAPILSQLKAVLVVGVVVAVGLQGQQQ